MGYPPKIPDISDIPYTRGLNDLSHRQGISPVSGSPEGTAGTRTLVQSIVCYTHHVIPITAGDGNERGLAVASRVCDRAENEVKAGVGIDTRRSARFQKP